MLRYWKKYKTIKNTVNMLREMQKQNITDDYSCGIYNGIEMCMAVVEEREPVFATYEKEPEVREIKEEKTVGRTVITGVRKVNEV